MTFPEPSNAALVQMTSPDIPIVTALARRVADPALPVMVVTITAPVDPLTLVTGKVIA